MRFQKTGFRGPSSEPGARAQKEGVKRMRKKGFTLIELWW